ncbi:hypothetical protein [Chryseobacterium cheonjiense]|uniref:Uncharacterized protein n=1 Tax=Chryseobacterium cheonjiense TaxID=2728845 RepID=A0A7Y0A373_9FLAO|nr:hypothetical protein [Chryseobacterium cheonjiense]NML55852.1 hypothetical protein [Chryseobacterium cheonjiense]
MMFGMIFYVDLHHKNVEMHTLSANDFNNSFDIDVPKVDSKGFLVELFYNSALGKFYVLKRVERYNKTMSNTLSMVIDGYRNGHKIILDPVDFLPKLKSIIHQHIELMDDLIESEYYSPKRSKKLKTLFSSNLKKMVRLESILIKQRDKGKPKLDDSDLINLVINNNSIELKNMMQKK